MVHFRLDKVINCVKKQKVKLPKVFVETGLYKGAGTNYALKIGFTKLYSIEIDENRVKQGQERFADAINDNKLSIILGDSSEELNKLLKTLDDEYVFFWLDAHLTNIPDGTNYPLQGELESIMQKNYEHCVIAIDDIKKTKTIQEWPFKERDAAKLLKKNGFTITSYDCVLIAYK